MSYSIAVADTGDYILVRVEGAVTVEEARRFGGEAHEKSLETGVPHFLFDVREARNEASVDSNYLYAKHDMDRLGFSREARSALLKSASDASHDFVEASMRDAGFNVRSFTEPAEAVAWVRGGDVRP